jgi:hypothetical protein
MVSCGPCALATVIKPSTDIARAPEKSLQPWHLPVGSTHLHHRLSSSPGVTTLRSTGWRAATGRLADLNQRPIFIHR